MAGPISFISDFGRDDEFVGVVHAVIARLAPSVRVIDLTHGIRRGDIRSGALALTRAIQYLPEGVALAVVDPTVGTARRAIAAATDWGFFVGPDNGLLSPAVAMVGGAHVVVSIENPDMAVPSPGATFQGRDVFAPAAALLAAGEVEIEELGPLVAGEGLQPLLLPLPKVEPPAVHGEVFWVDTYGNVETNIGPDDLAVAGLRPGDPVEVVVGGSSSDAVWVTSFGEVGDGELLVHVDSAGLIAIAVNKGRADEELSLVERLPVVLRGRGTPKAEGPRPPG